ncbi:hypothetical protein PC116_g18723 [Phytophthora cactorum]|nr:hypothetical protein GQ600_8480 [Phytophthora cactorum]KAG2891888.1 hypothetical protein PC114_g16828 [Phytophthora cactorum]KAG2925196.1 hypothetical protein PC117_g15211 [Phytophthora cactorum]KAG3001359.1 hypothetical protein PC119_g16747 [Phytophthora cactorum]KAG3147691.1 hypothetical protein C6341_g17653 [Phytophthora cactorum]
MSAATNSQQVVVTDWTVKNPGSVVPRSCNGYESWIVEQLRKEFTEMNFRLHRKANEAKQIRHLNAFDATRNSVQSAVDDENQLQPVVHKPKYCCIQLLNVLLTESLASQLGSSEDASTSSN